MLKLIKYRVGGLGMCLSGYTEEIALCGNTPPIVLDLSGFVVPNAVVTPYGQCPPEAVLPTSPTLKPHEFKNATIPQGESIWTVPPTAASPVSKFQITVRDINGSVVAVRAVAISQTTFKITSPLSISGVSIFVNPIETST
jgi:hypothetical protein